MPGAAVEPRSEVDELRARVAELERELAERTERANAAVAAAEERLYWLDRWRVDLDAVMQRRWAQSALRATDQARRARRVLGRIRRRLTR